VPKKSARSPVARAIDADANGEILAAAIAAAGLLSSRSPRRRWRPSSSRALDVRRQLSNY
jgi:hypothetical protein